MLPVLFLDLLRSDVLAYLSKLNMLDLHVCNRACLVPLGRLPPKISSNEFIPRPFTL